MVSIQSIAQTLNMAYDKANDYAFGNLSGFNTMINYNKTSGLYQVSTNVVGGEFGDYAINSIKAQSPSITNIAVNKSHITASVMRGADEATSLSNVTQATRTLTGYFATNGMQNSCGVCNNPNAALTPYKISEFGYAVCPNCEASTIAPAATVQKPNNLAKGMLGAFLGTLVGVAAILIASSLGYVASISGVIMAVAALKGYEMFGGRLTKSGVLLTLLLMVFMTIFANAIDWAMVLADYYAIGIFDALTALPLIFSDSSAFGEFLSTSTTLLLYTGLGSIFILISAFRQSATKAATSGSNISKLEQRY